MIFFSKKKKEDGRHGELLDKLMKKTISPPEFKELVNDGFCFAGSDDYALCSYLLSRLESLEERVKKWKPNPWK